MQGLGGIIIIVIIIINHPSGREVVVMMIVCALFLVRARGEGAAEHTREIARRSEAALRPVCANASSLWPRLR